MPKQGSTRKKKARVAASVAADQAEEVLTGGDPVPSPGDYLKAVWQLVVNHIRTHKLRFFLSVLLVIGVVVLLGWLLWPSSGPLTHDEIVIRVNKELHISGDSNPAVLTVDKEDEARAAQPFLQGAENGDKVLLYYKAKKSVLFRPDERRIVHQGSYMPPDAKIFIRQGTADSAKVDEVKQQLEEISDIELSSQDSSPKKDYNGVTIVNVTDRYDDKARELEQLFGAKVVRIPAGESFPDADILIIVGS